MIFDDSIPITRPTEEEVIMKTNFGVTKNPLPWVDEVLGVEHQNFFEGRATAYQKAGLRGNQAEINFAELKKYDKKQEED